MQLQEKKCIKKISFQQEIKRKTIPDSQTMSVWGSSLNLFVSHISCSRVLLSLP